MVKDGGREGKLNFNGLVISKQTLWVEKSVEKFLITKTKEMECRVGQSCFFGLLFNNSKDDE